MYTLPLNARTPAHECDMLCLTCSGYVVLKKASCTFKCYVHYVRCTGCPHVLAVSYALLAEQKIKHSNNYYLLSAYYTCLAEAVRHNIT